MNCARIASRSGNAGARPDCSCGEGPTANSSSAIEIIGDAPAADGSASGLSAAPAPGAEGSGALYMGARQGITSRKQRAPSWRSGLSLDAFASGYVVAKLPDAPSSIASRMSAMDRNGCDSIFLQHPESAICSEWPTPRLCRPACRLRPHIAAFHSVGRTSRATLRYSCHLCVIRPHPPGMSGRGGRDRKGRRMDTAGPLVAPSGTGRARR